MNALARSLVLVALAGVPACRDDSGEGGDASALVTCTACARTADCPAGGRCYRRGCISADEPPAAAGAACTCTAQCQAPLPCSAGICGAARSGGDDAGTPDGGGDAGVTAPFNDPWPTPPGCTLSHPYGFVSMYTGRTRVLDLCSCNRNGWGTIDELLVLKHGDFVTHTVAIDHPRREVWVGNQATNEVWVVRVARDLQSYEVVRRIAMPTAISYLAMSPNRRLIGVAPALPQVNYGESGGPGTEHVVFIDTGLRAVVAAVKTDSPSAVFFSPDSREAYVPNVNHRNIVVIDLDSFQIRKKVDVLWPEGRAGVGPPPFCELSVDGRWFVAPGMDAHRIWIYDVASDFEDFWYLDTPGEMPHMPAIRPGTNELYFHTFGWWPTPLTEDENPRIPSWVYVVDMDTHEVKSRFRWEPNGVPTLIGFIEITPDASMFWASGSYASIIGFDLDTHEVRCSISLESGPMPAFVLDN